MKTLDLICTQCGYRATAPSDTAIGPCPQCQGPLRTAAEIAKTAEAIGEAIERILTKKR